MNSGEHIIAPVTSFDEAKASAVTKNNLTRFMQIAIAVCVLVSVQVFFLMRENDKLAKEQEQINHRLDEDDAYQMKFLIDGAKVREQNYYSHKRQLEIVLEHCRAAGCNLPAELSVMPKEEQFEPMDKLLMRARQKALSDNKETY